MGVRFPSAVQTLQEVYMNTKDIEIGQTVFIPEGYGGSHPAKVLSILSASKLLVEETIGGKPVVYETEDFHLEPRWSYF